MATSQADPSSGDTLIPSKKIKGRAIEVADVIVATGLNITEAIKCFKEKHGTNIFHDDCDYRIQKADKIEEKLAMKSGECINKSML